MSEVRLQKFLAEAGVASRRKSEELILHGRIRVNGKVITELGTKVAESDIVEVDGKKVALCEQKVYIMLNKPVGYVSTAKDQFSRKTVIDLLNSIKARVYPVGRLDYDTSGLLFLTNDGEFTYRLTHPSHEIDKVYTAEVLGIPNEEELENFRKGIRIDNYITAPAEIKIIKKLEKTSVLEIIIHEGKNRQVRRMCEAIGHPVIKLKRTAIGNVSLDDLKEGNWRYLSQNEIKNLID